MRSSFLPFARPSLGEDEIREVVDTLRSGWITTGPKTERFAAAFLDYVGGRFAVPVSSATAGLHAALLALGIGPGDEVVTTPMTFVATLNAIVHCGAVPVLVDIDAATLQMRVEGIEGVLTPRTKAIVPVHYVGQPVDMDPLLALASARGLAVLEDAAHAVGTEYRGRRIGSFATTSVFSFHPNKNITTGEGGMIVTEDPGVFERASLLKFHGMDREAWKRFAKEGSPRYDVAVPGFKYNMMDLQAALGLHQLKRLDGFIAERTRLAGRYDAAFAGTMGLILPSRVPYPSRHAWHLYTPLLDVDRLTISRDRFLDELKRRNIGTGLHYTAAHEFSYYERRFGWKPDDFPEAHFVSERILSLPLFPDLSDEDQDDAIAAVLEVLEEFREVRVSVVVPVFDEEKNLPELVSRLRAVMDGTGEPYELVFVDDGSRDDSLAVLKQAAAAQPDRIRVLELARNFGQHQAILAAFESVTGDVVVTLDADLQNPPEEIPKLLAKIREGYDVVGGVRQNRQDAFLRRLASAVVNRVTVGITRMRITDFGCMLRAYSRGVVEEINRCDESSTFIPALAQSFARKPTEVPVAHAARRHGQSAYSLYRLVRLNFDLMTGFSLVPLQVFGLFGTVVAFGGIAFGIFLFVRRLIVGAEVEGVFTLFAILFTLLGIAMAGLGLVGEYVGRIYQQVRGRPRFRVRRVYGLGASERP